METRPTMVVPLQQHKRKHTKRWLVWLLPVLILGAAVVNVARPLPAVQPTAIYSKVYPAQTVALAWPKFGQAALTPSADTPTNLMTSGNQTPLATASIAKVITSLCILEKYPLATGQSGPSVTLTPADVDIYNQYTAKDGSAVAVQADEQLSEYQLLQAMLIPSANNLADSSAIWAFGSLDAYHSYANQYLARHGLTNTHVAVDASGFDGATTSTASDVVHLGELALKEPVLKEIMQQASATLPVAGTVTNYNALLGTDGIIGIKTGNNDQDPGAFLFAANLPIGGTTQTMVGAVMGAGSLGQALQSSLPLISSAGQGFEVLTAIGKGQTVGTYHAAWGATAQAVSSQAVTAVRWKGTAARLSTQLQPVTAGSTPTTVGTVHLRTNQTRIITATLNHPVAGPSFWWRLTRH